MTKRVKIIGSIAVVALAAGGGAAWATAGGSSDPGPGANQARAAALAKLGGGTVNAVERDSEKGATWEVEVKKADGSTVDVRLDAAYKVIAVDSDSETADETGQSDANDQSEAGER